MRKAREEAGLSQKEVAISLGVSAPTVSDWESGKKNPNSTNLRELVKLYNASADYLLGITDKADFPPDVSRRICEEISNEYTKNRETFNNFFIPPEVFKKILDGTYIFNNVNFPQFAHRLKLSLPDFFNKKTSTLTKKDERDVTDNDLKLALFGGGTVVTDEMWEEAQFAAQLIKERHKRKTEKND